MTTQKTVEQLHAEMRAKIKAQSSELLRDGLLTMEAPTMPMEQRLVRALILDELELRHGGDYLDALLDELEKISA